MSKKTKWENVRVVARCRPFSPREIEECCRSVVHLDLATNQVLLNLAEGERIVNAFDAVYNNSYAQRDIFVHEVVPMVDFALEGYNTTVVACGASGAGKSHTIRGNLDIKEYWGMLPLAVEYLFAQQTSAFTPFIVKLSCLEVHHEKVADLLAEDLVPLPIKKNGAKKFFVSKASEIEVKSLEDCLKLLSEAQYRPRHVVKGLNEKAIPCHSMTRLTIEQQAVANERELVGLPQEEVVVSHLNFFELANMYWEGKVDDTGVPIGGSPQIAPALRPLLAVVESLTEGKERKHVPFRASPLTKLLKDSLGGNCRTVFFANVGPSDRMMDVTLKTLRFGTMVKQILNKPKKNSAVPPQPPQELRFNPEPPGTTGDHGDTPSEDSDREAHEV